MSAVRRLFFFCPRAADIHIHYFEKDETYIEELTETEKQVLRMLASSMKRKEIAEHLLDVYKRQYFL